MALKKNMLKHVRTARVIKPIDAMPSRGKLFLMVIVGFVIVGIMGALIGFVAEKYLGSVLPPATINTAYSEKHNPVIVVDSPSTRANEATAQPLAENNSSNSTIK